MQLSEIYIVDFEPEHFARITLRKEDALDIKGLETEALLRGWVDGRSVLYGDQVVCFYGVSINDGVGQIWSVTSPLAERLPLLITRIGQGLVKSLIRYGCHRVEVFCHVKNKRSLRWLTRCLGFRVEGLLRQSGPNRQDRYILAIVNKETIQHPCNNVQGE